MNGVKERLKEEYAQDPRILGLDNWYFTSDLHLNHQSIMKGFRGDIFKSIEEHNSTIINNLLEIPRDSNLMIAGDLFWKCNTAYIKEFFASFKKRKINVHIVYGNHDKMSWFKASNIASQGHIKEISKGSVGIIISHYPMIVWNRSHYNTWNLHGHIHKNDATWIKLMNHNNDSNFNGKHLNINTELHDFKPWNFAEVGAYMDKREDNWDLLKK